MKRTRWITILQIAIGLVMLGLILQNSRQHQEQLVPILGSLQWHWLGLALLTQIIGFLFLPLPTTLFLSKWQSKTDYFLMLRLFFLSQPAKYLPGSFWTFPTRGILLKLNGVSLSHAGLAISFEVLMLIASALMLGLLGISKFPSPIASTQPMLLLILIAALIGACVLIREPNWFVNLLAWIKTSYQPKSRRSDNNWLKIFLGSLIALVFSWALSGLSFSLILNALNLQFALETVSSVLPAFSLSWLLGFVIFLSPGGLGAREASLLFLLGSSLGEANVTIAALLSRILWTTGEGILYFVAASSQPSDDQIPN